MKCSEASSTEDSFARRVVLYVDTKGGMSCGTMVTKALRGGRDFARAMIVLFRCVRNIIRETMEFIRWERRAGRVVSELTLRQRTGSIKTYTRIGVK